MELLGIEQTPIKSSLASEGSSTPVVSKPTEAAVFSHSRQQRRKSIAKARQQVTQGWRQLQAAQRSVRVAVAMTIKG